MPSSRQYVFGEFCLDAQQRALFCRRQFISLTPKSLETLLFLVERHGRIVEKKELMDAVWPDTFVEEISLARNISVLRKALSGGDDGQTFIETVPKRGYRFSAPVEVLDQESSVAASPAMPAREKGWASESRGRRLALALLAVPLLAGAGLVLLRRNAAPARSPETQAVMLAVLPVQNLTGDPELEYLSDGLTEEMIAQLGSMNPGRLGVIARTSSMAYKSTQKTAGQIGQELGVDYVLESSVRGTGERLRITTQLIRTRDQTHLWAESYDRTPSDTLSLENEIGREVANRIRLSMSPTERSKLEHARSLNPQAYAAYLKGRYFWNKRTPEAMSKAEKFFQQAIAADPDYAPAYAGLSDCYQVMVNVGQLKAGEGFARARTAALKALELDSTLAEAHTSLASIKEDYDWDWPGAESEYEQALAFNANYATAHHWYGNFLASLERFDQATEEIKKAEALDPLSPVLELVLAQGYCQVGSCEQAIEQLKKTVETYPDFAEAHGALAEVYAHQGMYQDYLTERQKEANLTPSRAPLWMLGYALAMAGHKREALAVLRKIERQSDTEHRDYSQAVIYAAVGDNDHAFARLEGAKASHDPYMAYFRADIKLDRLKSDPRYAGLVRQMNMPAH